MFAYANTAFMRTTVALDDALAAHVDAQRPSADASDAEAVRECVRRSKRLEEAEADIADLEGELQSKDARIDDLQRQLAATNQRIDVTNELVAEVRSDVSTRERKAKAGIGARAKWFLFGMPDTDE